MKSTFVGGIDGTGDFSDRSYSTEFENSFVHRVQNFWYFAERNYQRGPSLEGATTHAKGQRLAQVISEYVRGKTEYEIYLTGYSRGGAAVIHTANLLQVKGISVKAMFLFDAVDRTMGGADTSSIGSNVAYCYHARRDPAAHSRSYFGNTGTKLGGTDSVGLCTDIGDQLKNGKTVYLERSFLGTHGAIGGVPQTEAGKDGFIHELRDVEPNDPSYKLLMTMGIAGAASLIIAGAISSYGRTTITPKQNQIAANEVWKWMQKNLTAQSSAAMSSIADPSRSNAMAG